MNSEAYAHKGVPIIRSALTTQLQLELTYRDVSRAETTDEPPSAEGQHSFEKWTVLRAHDTWENPRAGEFQTR
jgi:hypothetical protein